MDKKQLIDATLKQIVEDVENGDLTAIEEQLLMACPKDAMLAYLPENNGCVALMNREQFEASP